MHLLQLGFIPIHELRVNLNLSRSKSGGSDEFQGGVADHNSINIGGGNFGSTITLTQQVS
jgi:hypothetical protein